MQFAPLLCAKRALFKTLCIRKLILTYLLRYKKLVNHADSSDSDALLLAQHRDSDARGASCHVSPVYNNINISTYLAVQEHY